MTIPHKGSRTVDVDGRVFRFLVKEKNIADHRDQWELSVTIQEDVERPGRPLQFTWPYGHAVTPEDVRAAVRDGMKAGWAPGSRGGVFRFAAEGGTAFQRANDE
jgi:hypothetical protein